MTHKHKTPNQPAPKKANQPTLNTPHPKPALNRYELRRQHAAGSHLSDAWFCCPRTRVALRACTRRARASMVAARENPVEELRCKEDVPAVSSCHSLSRSSPPYFGKCGAWTKPAFPKRRDMSEKNETLDHGWPESITAPRSFPRKFLARCAICQLRANRVFCSMPNDSHDDSAQ